MNESQGATADITVARVPEVTGIQITDVSGDGIADLSSYTAIRFSASFDNGTEKTGELRYGDTRGEIDDINFDPYLMDQDGKEHGLSEALNRSPSSRQLKKYKFFLPVEIYLLAVLCSLQVNFVFFHWC